MVANSVQSRELRVAAGRPPPAGYGRPARAWMESDSESEHESSESDDDMGGPDPEAGVPRIRTPPPIPPRAPGATPLAATGIPFKPA